MYLMFAVDVFVGGFPRLKHGLSELCPLLTICLHFFWWCKDHKIHPTSNMTSSEPRSRLVLYRNTKDPQRPPWIIAQGPLIEGMSRPADMTQRPGAPATAAGLDTQRAPACSGSDRCSSRACRGALVWPSNTLTIIAGAQGRGILWTVSPIVLYRNIKTPKDLHE